MCSSDDLGPSHPAPAEPSQRPLTPLPTSIYSNNSSVFLRPETWLMPTRCCSCYTGKSCGTKEGRSRVCQPQGTPKHQHASHIQCQLLIIGYLCEVAWLCMMPIFGMAEDWQHCSRGACATRQSLAGRQWLAQQVMAHNTMPVASAWTTVTL